MEHHTRGSLVWVNDAQAGWVKGEVLGLEGSKLRVRTETGVTRLCSPADCPLQNPSSRMGVEVRLSSMPALAGVALGLCGWPRGLHLARRGLGCARTRALRAPQHLAAAVKMSRARRPPARPAVRLARVCDGDWRRAAAQDMTTLSYLNEPGVLWNLRCRYVLDAIYTYTGSILIAVNPFARLPHLYGAHMMEQYRGRDLGELSPHVYAIADAAYRQMRKEMRSQSILVRGSAWLGAHVSRVRWSLPGTRLQDPPSAARCVSRCGLGRRQARPTGRRAAGERRERRRQDGDGEADHAVPGVDGQRGRARGGAQRGAAGASTRALLLCAQCVGLRSARRLPDQALRWRQPAAASIVT